MAVNDVYESSLLFSIKGEKCACVLHYQETTDPGSGNELNLASTIYSQIWTPSMKVCLSNDAQLQTIRVRRIDPTAGGPIDLPVLEAGTISVDVMPPNNCILISLMTDRLDKSGRGRIHISGAPKTHNQDGLLDVTNLSLWNSLATALIAPMTGSSSAFQLGVWSRKETEFNSAVDYNVRSWHHTLRSRRMAAP